MSRRTTAFHRAAISIHEELCRARPIEKLSLPGESWAECSRILALIGKAERRGLTAATRRLQSTLVAATLRVSNALRIAERAMARTLVGTQPTIRDILGDLESLVAEFDEVSVNMQRHVVSVTTDDVILEDVDLGRFEIVLDWQRLRETGAYEVIAVDDRSAATDCDTTHPHVQSNSLCEGEGKAAIRTALQDGRLYDFFILVRQILHTYNSSSAYVQLSDWFGIQCPECGSTASDDESNLCEGCSTTTCFECSTNCTDCDYRYCSDCTRTCDGCDSDTCSSCRSQCRECGDGFCKGCIDDERCNLCIENSEEENEAETDSETVVATQAAVQPTNDSLHSLCVGEAALSERRRQHGDRRLRNNVPNRSTFDRRRLPGSATLHVGHRRIRRQLGRRLLRRPGRRGFETRTVRPHLDPHSPWHKCRTKPHR